MARIAVLHTDLSAKGGAEAVCMATLEALQDDHDVTLFTYAEPDLTALDAFFGTDVADVEVVVPVRIAPAVNAAAAILNATAGFGLELFRRALLARRFSDTAPDFDVVVSTDNEIAVDRPAVQYIHSPKADRGAVPGIIGGEVRLGPLYDWLCERVGRFDRERVADDIVLANSSWTADVVREVYDGAVEPEVVYPPVHTDRFSPRPWDEREPGFLTIGRISRVKNIDRNIEIVRRVRGRGHDVHLHVIGPVGHPRYARRVEQTANRHDFVQFDGELDRESLDEMIETHRFGLHGRDHEHFGMAIAEMAAGGVLPFVPDGGGQVEIVEGEPGLCYAATDEAVDKIDRVLSDPAHAERLRAGLPPAAETFGAVRFHRAVRDVVSRSLDRTGAA